MGRASLAIACTIAAAAPPRRAAAAEPDDKQRAQALFETGKVAMEGGNFAAACPELAQSLMLDSQLGTMLNLALCYESIGKRAKACRLWQQSAERAAHKRQLEREGFARERAEQLCPSLPKLNVQVAPQPALDRLLVTLNGEPLPRADWGQPLPVEPGDCDVRATAEGLGAWSTDLWVGEHDRRMVLVPPLVAERGVSPADQVPLASPAARRKTLKTAAWVSAGLGVSAVGIGAAFAIAASLNKSSSNADRSCVGTICNETGARDRARALDDAHSADIAFAVGSGALATSVIFWILSPRDRVTASSLVISPGVAREACWLTIQQALP